MQETREMQDTFEYLMGSRVRCAGDECGEVESVVVDPVADVVTHLVVRPDGAGGEPRLVPVHLALPGPDDVYLNCTRDRFDEFEPAQQTFFRPAAGQAGSSAQAAQAGQAGQPGQAAGSQILEWPFYGLAPSPALAGFAPGVEPAPATTTVERIPVGEVSIRRGERVHAVDGEIGRVRGLVVVPPDSAVSHVLLDEGHFWGHKRVAIPIGDVTGIGADGVSVRLAKDEIKDLPPVDVEGL